MVGNSYKCFGMYKCVMDCFFFCIKLNYALQITTANYIIIVKEKND